LFRFLAEIFCIEMVWISASRPFLRIGIAAGALERILPKAIALGFRIRQ